MTEAMRIPPNAIDAERSVLGGIMLEPTAFDVVAGVLRDREDFYAQANALIFDAMRAITKRSLPIDHTTLRDELVRTSKIAQVGGDEYLFALTNVLPTVENIEAHAGIVREKAIVRRLIAACHEIAATGYGDYGSIESYRDRSESMIFKAIASSESNVGPAPVDIVALMRRVQDAASGKIDPNGHTTGIDALDAFTTGAYQGDLIVVAGRPGMGKSALGMGAGFAACEATKLPALYYSLEMQRDKCERRLLSMISGVDGGSIRRGRITDSGWRHITHASQRIDASKFQIDAQPGLTLSDIRSRSRRVASKHGGLACLVVDYLQLMNGAGDESSREQEISKISRGLKTLAKELQCPIYALSQLNRSCEERPDKRPQVSDLRESGAIEQDADSIWLLYRRGYYAAQMAKEEAEGTQAPQSKFKPRCTIQPGEDDGKGDIIVGKQRDGATGVVRVRFDGPCTRYVDVGFVQPNPGYADPYAHIGGSPDDGSGDGEPFNDEDWNR